MSFNQNRIHLKRVLLVPHSTITNERENSLDLSARLQDNNQHDEMQLIFSQGCWIVKTASAPFMPCGQNTFSLPILTLSDSVRVNYN